MAIATTAIVAITITATVTADERRALHRTRWIGVTFRSLGEHFRQVGRQIFSFDELRAHTGIQQ
jgi:hypothetical protein